MPRGPSTTTVRASPRAPEQQLTPQEVTPTGPLIVLGAEGAGKTALLAAASGRPSRSANLRGSTVACEEYRIAGEAWLDTPGLTLEGDTAAMQDTLARLPDAGRVLLVVRATHLDDDLALLLPLAGHRPTAVAVTYQDKVAQGLDSALAALGAETRVPFIPLDARAPSTTALQELQDALQSARPAATATPHSRAGWRIEPHRAWFDHAAIAGLLLLLPAVLAVTFANLFAGLIEPIVAAITAPLAARAAALPTLLAAVLAGDYGLLTMGPLLLVWAAPTVILFAVLLGTYKATGMLDRITTSLHPHLRSFGLTGRDLARVVMGAGCNVPAVLATRSSPSCSRGTCMSTISFGAACSYQFGATLAVFAAAGMWLLIFPYLLALAAATLGYAAWVSRFGRGMGALVTPGRVFLEAPSAGAVWREARSTIRGFFVTAVPVFLVIAAVASLLHLWGALEWAAAVINPAMALFGLPSAAALPVVLASIRKDGILLFDSSAVLDVITPGQLLVGVFLAGVLLPCIVTAWTVWRESSGRFVAKMMARQAVAALVATFVLAWVVFGLERIL